MFDERTHYATRAETIALSVAFLVGVPVFLGVGFAFAAYTSVPVWVVLVLAIGAGWFAGWIVESKLHGWLVSKWPALGQRRAPH